MPISVIIPAHNESAVIARTLKALLDGAAPGELEVIVVCNGCNDDTAEIARRFGPSVRVVETPVAGKVKALNLGDQIAKGYPRFYLDADVVLPIASFRRIAERLKEGTILAAAPTPSFELKGCSWFVKAYYHINIRLPSSKEGIGGSGVYALSALGRSRFADFPDVIADDGFVRIQFKPTERETIAECPVTVFAPKRLADLIAIKTRSHFGSCELRRRYPELWVNKGASNRGELLRLGRNLLLWPQLLVYCYIKVAVRLRAKGKLLRASYGTWERDDSSREHAAGIVEKEPV